MSDYAFGNLFPKKEEKLPLLLNFLFILILIINIPFLLFIHILMMNGLFITRHKNPHPEGQEFVLELRWDDRFYLQVVGMIFSFCFYFTLIKIFL